MFITGESLCLYYWQYTKSGGGPANLPEIQKEEYGYELQPGQTLFAIRYNKSNLECYFGCKVHDVSNDGLLISSDIPARTGIMIPWVKEFPVPAPFGKKVMCDLFIEPCECLFEQNKLIDILKGNIESETIKDHKIIVSAGIGIWHKHGGWRALSRYEENLKYFSKNGQLEIV